MSRTSRRVLVEVVAECDGCAWSSAARNALATGARHHDASGHLVRVYETYGHTFGDPTAQPPGQTALDVIALNEEQQPT